MSGIFVSLHCIQLTSSIDAFSSDSNVNHEQIIYEFLIEISNQFPISQYEIPTFIEGEKTDKTEEVVYRLFKSQSVYTCVQL